MKTNFSFTDAKPYLVKKEATIIQAMKIIDKGEERICFVVDNANKLIKVISDGDIRRALLNKSNLNSKIISIHKKKPHVIRDNMVLEEVEKVLTKRVSIVPVVDMQGKVVGVLRYRDVIPQIDIKSYRVCILGLGYVGLTLGLVLADHGFKVIGFDTDKKLVRSLKKKKTPFYEKGINNYINKHIGHNLKVTYKHDQINSDIYIITVGTPINKETKKPQMNNLLKAVDTISKKIKKNDFVVLRSTVPIGCTRKIVIPRIQRASSLKPGEHFSVAFCPERTVEGQALKELTNLPQLVGGFDMKSRELGLRLFGENTHTVIDIGSLEAAEMCKLMDNTYRDVRFSFANQMAELSEKYGLNVHYLIDKINLSYARNTIPMPSPGVGGACLSKDPYILMSNFEENHLDCSLLRASRNINELAPKNIFLKTKSYMKKVKKDLKKSKIFIIGIAFKGEPETSDLRDSTTIWFIDELKKNKIRNIWVYDPVVEKKDIIQLDVKPCSLEKGFDNADAVFIMNNHISYSSFNLSRLLNKMNDVGYFFDGWNIFKPSDIVTKNAITYSGIGLK